LLTYCALSDVYSFSIFFLSFFLSFLFTYLLTYRLRDREHHWQAVSECDGSVSLISAVATVAGGLCVMKPRSDDVVCTLGTESTINNQPRAAFLRLLCVLLHNYTMSHSTVV